MTTTDEQKEAAKRHIERQFGTMRNLAHPDDLRLVCDMTMGAVIALEAVGLLTHHEVNQYEARIAAIRSSR